MADHEETNLRRRALLQRIGLASGLAYVAPVLTTLGVARASGASGGSGGGGRGGGSRPVVRQQRRVAKPQPQRVRRAPPPPDPELVVLLPPGATAEAVTQAGYDVLASSPVGGATLLRLALPSGETPETALARLAGSFPGAVGDENHLYAPDDFLCEAGDCAAHEMIGWSGWPSAYAPRIGMIDTGINTDHEALRGQKLTVHQVDLGKRDAAGRQHGTAIAALLLGRLDSRTPGLLPHAELVAVEAFHNRGGADQADAFSLGQALERMVAAGVSVINMSFSGPENIVLKRLVEHAAAQGIGLVAAAGNDGPGAGPAWPAAWPEVIAVTAVDDEQRSYRQANRGPYVTLAGPGVNLWTAASISGGRLRSGTSYAAPFVTAALAIEQMRNPDAPVAAVVAGLIGCAKDLGEAGFDETFGHGLVTAPNLCTATVAGDGAKNYLTSGE
ncbi:S8 family serine peptidase [Gemmobacter fulvus]|uniref:S8 family serine peptidase n=1 Tax=Gemmobacter fulvus TaxID=2840474 RepID=UPI0027968C35|nr:S8 family serine peptidase [Gemmobacter fulvus]MDQ1847278.1 S8 family serine peptidase [Gemmobacter fulvus]